MTSVVDRAEIETLAARFKRARHDNGLTAQELAVASEVSRGTINAIEQGVTIDRG